MTSSNLLAGQQSWHLIAGRVWFLNPAQSLTDDICHEIRVPLS
jgi:hypothetical protein